MPSKQDQYVEFLQDVLITQHANIRELRERKNFADPEEHTHIEANSWHTLKCYPYFNQALMSLVLIEMKLAFSSRLTIHSSLQLGSSKAVLLFPDESYLRCTICCEL